MQMDTRGVARQHAAEADSAIKQGSQRLTAEKGRIREALKQPDPVRVAVDATVDGLFAIYEKNSNVILAIKEHAVKVRQAGAVIDIHA